MPIVGRKPRRVRRRRLRHIAWILARHGLGAFTNELGVGRLIPFQWGILGHSRRRGAYSTPEHIRLAFEEMGTVAIKVGQVLSTRPDLLAPDLVAELELLRDRVPPVGTEAIIAVIESELAQPITKTFAYFDLVPIAAASIGQVHAARLSDGEEVVVKVRKPGVVEEVETDLDLLTRLAARIASGDTSPYDLAELAADFSWTLRSELDYRLEARNAGLLRALLAEDPRVVVPLIHADLSTGAVLTMERLDGVRIDDTEGIRRMGIDPGVVARTHAQILLHQVFEAGFFHADPHPGNFLVRADGRIAMIDFGMVGRLEEGTRRAFVRLLIASARQDAEGMVLAMEALGLLHRPGDRDPLRRDLHRMLDRYYGLSVDQFSLANYLIDLLDVIRRRHLQLPSDLALLLKTIGMSDGLWRRLDPSFNAWAIGQEFTRRLAGRLYSPQALARRTIETAVDLLESGLPGVGCRKATELVSAEVSEQVASAAWQLREAANQISRAILSGGLLVGLGVLTIAYRPPGWKLIAPVLLLAGSSAALWLAFRLIRSGRRRPPR